MCRAMENHRNHERTYGGIETLAYTTPGVVQQYGPPFAACCKLRSPAHPTDTTPRTNWFIPYRLAGRPPPAPSISPPPPPPGTPPHHPFDPPCCFHTTVRAPELPPRPLLKYSTPVPSSLLLVSTNKHTRVRNRLVFGLLPVFIVGVHHVICITNKCSS